MRDFIKGQMPGGYAELSQGLTGRERFALWLQRLYHKVFSSPFHNKCISKGCRAQETEKEMQ